MAGIQGGSIYYYFSSKKEILLEIMQCTLNELLAGLVEGLKDLEDPIDKLKWAVRWHIEYHIDHRHETFITDSEIRSLEEPDRAVVVGLRRKYEDVFLMILREGKEQGKIKLSNENLVNYAILQMCTGVSIWYDPTGPLTVKEVVEVYFEFILRGI